jgi:nucleotide-binding universal stress UspA family protein
MEERLQIASGRTMSYPTLLLPLEDDPRAGARLALTLRLAQQWRSHVIGLSCRRPAPALDGGLMPLRGLDPSALDLLHAQQMALEREQAFHHRCEASGLASFELRADADEPGRAVTRHAHGCDLVVLGQPDPDDPECAAHRTVLEYALLHNARPALVVPYAGHFEAPGRTILLAWDDSREAARAATDALPLMRRAAAVHVVQFEPVAAAPGSAAAARLAPLVQWLAGHGIETTPTLLRSPGDVGNALLSHAADIDADLLVMGAWGTSRWAERVLGGTTRTVLASMTLPVLMAH